MLTVRFCGFNDVVLGTTQTRGKAHLQLGNALLVLRGPRQHRKLPRLDTGTISEIRAASFMSAYRIIFSGLSRHSLNFGEGESHGRDIIAETPSPSPSATSSTTSGH